MTANEPVDGLDGKGSEGCIVSNWEELIINSPVDVEDVLSISIPTDVLPEAFIKCNSSAAG